MTPETSIYEYAKASLSISEDRPAIWFRDKALSYGELFRMIDNVADHLALLGVKEGTVVSIHLPNCPQAIIAIYAVAKLGAICNMIHPLMPEDKLNGYLQFAESELLISFNRKTLEDNRDQIGIYVDIDSYVNDFPEQVDFDANHRIHVFSALLGNCPEAVMISEQPSLAGKCVAYMHSSGTTGSPKTVMLSHKAMNLLVANLKSHYGNDALHEQVCLGIAPLHHSLGFLNDLHRTLCYGGQLIMMERWNCDEAVMLIKLHRVTYMAGVPGMYRSLLQHSGFYGSAISSLKYCIIAGEPVPAELICQLDQRVGNGPVTLCAYGLAEICGAICAHSHEHRNTAASGYPLDNTSIMVLDADGAMKKTGKGQLVVSSNSMMLGYLKDPQATEEVCFRYDNKVWLKTGDFGQVDEEGYVTCLSRMKDVIIRKGNNIFPSEVEQVIGHVPEVAQVCVVGIPDEENMTEAVCAAVVLRSDADEQMSKSCILDECRRLLPRYAVPGRIVFMEQLPHNKMGKMDRKLLKDLL